MKCGCSFLDRVRCLLKPKVKFGSVDDYVVERGKAVPIRGKAEEELINECLRWGEHVRDPRPEVMTGDTVVFVDYFDGINVCTIRKTLKRREG